MDIWQNIKKRASDMDAANAEQARKDSVAEAKRKRREQEITEIIIAVTVVVVVVATIVWAAWEAFTFCSKAVCGI